MDDKLVSFGNNNIISISMIIRNYVMLHTWPWWLQDIVNSLWKYMYPHKAYQITYTNKYWSNM